MPTSQKRVSNQTPRPFVALIVLAGLCFIAGTAAQADDANCDLSPSIGMKPRTVVETVIDALRTNDSGDNGIATVYCFASPGNKQVTGPFERFAMMIKRGYGDMLNHSDSDFDQMEVSGEVAMQSVWLTTPEGTVVGYMFRLGKQDSGEFAGMWMTEAVYRLDPAKRERSI